jgi:hypothetical protein
MSTTSSQSGGAASPPPQPVLGEIIITDSPSSPMGPPFNAICLTKVQVGNAFQPATAFIVKTRTGGLAAITAAHVLVDRGLGFDCTTAPGSITFYPGAYALNPDGTYKAKSPPAFASSCLVHENYQAQPGGGNQAYDIGIAFLAGDTTLVGPPMSWADAGGILPKSPQPASHLSITGHYSKESGGDPQTVAQLRMVKIDRYGGQSAPNVFIYTAEVSTFGGGFSGGPLMNVWATSQNQIRDGVAYGHHIKASSSQRVSGGAEAAQSPPARWFGAIEYAGEISAWLRSKGL